MLEAGRLLDRDGVAAPATDRPAAGQHGGLVRGVADALQFQRATAAAEDRGAVPKWLVTILLFFELSLLAGERTCGRGGGEGGILVQRSTSFSHELGDAFQIFCCFLDRSIRLERPMLVLAAARFRVHLAEEPGL